MIPTPTECFLRMEEYRMLDNIRDHSIVVARITEYLVAHLMATGSQLSMPLAVAGALLHDIGKTPCLGSDDDHAGVGKDICLAHDYQELASIVGEHVVLRNGLPKDGVSEKEIVYYSDKRVTHDKIVSLADRKRYILDRYGNNDERRFLAIERNFLTCQRLEERLFARLPIAPEQIAEAVQQHQSSFLKNTDQ